jgi:hypothetical protein
VDRVVEVEYGKYAVGYKNVTINDNFFTGHFPERPIMPGARRRRPAAAALPPPPCRCRRRIAAAAARPAAPGWCGARRPPRRRPADARTPPGRALLQACCRSRRWRSWPAS